MQFKVYILYSPKHDQLFTGLTASLIDRMTAHNGNEAEDWTTVYRPWTLIHMELFTDEAEAHIREGYLDSDQGKEYIRADILPMYDFN